MNIMRKVKKYIKFMIKGIWHILPISSKKKVVLQYKWQVRRSIRFFRRDVSREISRDLEEQYKSARGLNHVALFEEQARKLHRQYKRIHVVKNNILNIGSMCYNYYSLCTLLEKCPTDEKIIFLLYDGDRPVYEMDDPRVSNQWLLSKLRELVEFIDLYTAPFWGYMTVTYRDLFAFNTVDDVGRILYPDRERVIHQKEYRYPSQAYLSFSKQEKIDGETALQNMGLKKGGYFCFFSRSNEYHERYFDNHGTEQADITARRNSSVDTFVQAIDQVNLSGLKAVRMGAVDSRKVTGENIFDYTNTCRDDFLDFFVMGQAKFFVGDTSGIGCIPWLMNKPQALTNNFTFFWRGPKAFNYNSKMNLSIYKKWWDRNKKRYLSLQEILDISWEYGVSDEIELRLCDQLGIEFHANTLDEIADLIYEMNLRIDGKWEENGEIKLLREKYWDILNGAIKKAHPTTVLWEYEPAGLFLKKNKWLLD